MCLLPGPGCQGRRTKGVIRHDVMGTGGNRPRRGTQDEEDQGRGMREEGGEDEGQCCTARRGARGYLHK
jgi:hypothetical protein